MEAKLRAGVAIYNAGRYKAAHDAWEDHWLDLDSGTGDEQFLHGLIQFTAAVFHARNGNWSGATGLAESSSTYLDGLDSTYRGVNVGELWEYLAALAADPECIERREPVDLTYRGSTIEPSDLDLEATLIAADVIAAEEGYDGDLIERSRAYARADVEANETGSPFVSLLFDFVREPEERDIIIQRLSEHAGRRASREADVEGVFE